MFRSGFFFLALAAFSPAPPSDGPELQTCNPVMPSDDVMNGQPADSPVVDIT